MLYELLLMFFYKLVIMKYLVCTLLEYKINFF